MALAPTEYYWNVPELSIKSRKENIPGINPASGDDVLADKSWYRLWEDHTDRPGTYYDETAGPLVINETPDPSRVEQSYTWVEWDYERQRAKIENDLSAFVQSNDEPQVSTRADPGRVVIMDEAVAIAEREQGRLDLTQDADLQALVLNLDPTTIGSIATATTLFSQTERVLREDPTLTQQERTDLEAVQVEYQAIATGTDDAVDVPAVPDASRRKIGVTGEGYGTIRVRRFEDGGWWWLEFLLNPNRELRVGDYWIALYNEGGTYLSTPQLTDLGNGRYMADKNAVQNAQSTDQVGFQYTLCFQHITAPQFSNITIAPGVHSQISRVRWNGNAQGTVSQARNRRGRT